jgi:hypothetical protein
MNMLVPRSSKSAGHNFAWTRLPPELWLEILERLDGAARSKVALTCKALRALSVSLSKTELHLTLPQEGIDGATQAHLTQRLQVRRMTISPATLHQPASVAFAPLQALVTSLPYFINLQSLIFRHIDFNRLQWQQLQQLLGPPPRSLSHLNCITLIHCLCKFPSVHLPRVALPHIYIEDELNQGWCHLASPAHLTHLTVTSMSAEEALLLPVLLELRFLRICRNSGSSLQCSHLLSGGKCPVLETFEMDAPTQHLDPQIIVTPDVEFDLPKLRSYRGPDTFAPMFARRAALIHASLWCAQHPSAEAHTTRAILVQLSQLSPALKTLELRDCRTSTSTLDAIGGFPMLDELVIDLRHLGVRTARYVYGDPYNRQTSAGQVSFLSGQGFS